MAVDCEHCCPGGDFRVKVSYGQKTEPQSAVVVGGWKAKCKTTSQNTWLPKKGGNKLPNMYFCCPWRQLQLVKSQEISFKKGREVLEQSQK